MRAAVRAGWEPVVFFDPDFIPGPRPHERSLAIVEALEIHESAVCSGCGQSSLLAYDPRNTGEWEQLHDVTCEACVVLEQDSERERQPGEIRYLQNHMSE